MEGGGGDDGGVVTGRGEGSRVEGRMVVEVDSFCRKHCHTGISFPAYLLAAASL